MPGTISKKEKQERLLRNEEKWSPALMEAGWTAFPSVFLERQHALGLDPIDVNILLQLARYWWYKDNPPRPSKKAIAECIGRSESTVQRRIAALEAAGYIKRVARFDPKYGQGANEYRFDGLIEAALPLAHELIADRKTRQKEDAERRIRKKPKKLRVIEGKKSIEDEQE